MCDLLTPTKRRIERLVLGRVLPGDFYMSVPGLCLCCQREVHFVAYDAWLRDHLRCDWCGSIPRQRALLKVVEDRFPNWRDLTIHESSPSWGGASGLIKRDCAGYVASQFRPGWAPGAMVDGYRNENLEALTFPDASVDIVVTQDVLEHVYDPAAVFREIGRTLKPGGLLVFTVPLINKHQPTERWATMNADGSPSFIKEPEFRRQPGGPERLARDDALRLRHRGADQEGERAGYRDRAPR